MLDVKYHIPTKDELARRRLQSCVTWRPEILLQTSAHWSRDKNGSIHCHSAQHSPLGMRVLDPYGLHQTLPPSIPSPQPTRHPQHQHVRSWRTKNHQCPDPEMCQRTWHSHLPHKKIPSLDWQTSKNANEQTTMPTPCRWVKNPWKRGKPQSILCNTMIELLQEALQDQVSQHLPLSEWIETAQDEKLWNNIIDKWHDIRDRKRSKSDYYVTLCNIFVFILWHVFDNLTFFSSRQNSVSKIKNIVANLLNVDKAKILLSEINSCIQFIWNTFQVL